MSPELSYKAPEGIYVRLYFNKQFRDIEVSDVWYAKVISPTEINFERHITERLRQDERLTGWAWFIKDNMMTEHSFNAKPEDRIELTLTIKASELGKYGI